MVECSTRGSAVKCEVIMLPMIRARIDKDFDYLGRGSVAKVSTDT